MDRPSRDLLKGSASLLTTFVRWTTFNVFWITLAINLYPVNVQDVPASGLRALTQTLEKGVRS